MMKRPRSFITNLWIPLLALLLAAPTVLAPTEANAEGGSYRYADPRAGVPDEPSGGFALPEDGGELLSGPESPVEPSIRNTPSQPVWRSTWLGRLLSSLSLLSGWR